MIYPRKHPRKRMVVRRVSAGVYIVNDRYLVQQTADGWRWSDAERLDTGGEWRSTKAAATADLLDYLVTNFPTLAELDEQRAAKK